MILVFIAATNLIISEITGGRSRIFFDEDTPEVNNATLRFTFETTEVPTCMNITAYAKVRFS